MHAEKKARKVDEAIKKYDSGYEVAVYRSGRNMYSGGKEYTVKSVEKSKKTIKTVDGTKQGVAIKGKNPSLKTRSDKVKTTQETSRATIKTAETSAKFAGKAARNSTEAARASARVAKSTAKGTAATLKTAPEAAVEIVKDLAAGTKALVSAMIAGGWVTIIVILVLCMVAMIAGSDFGIFFK